MTDIFSSEELVVRKQTDDLKKFFDAKNREGQVNMAPRRVQGQQGGMSTSPLPGQRHDPAAMNGMGGNVGDSRAMEELFAMLQNSSPVSIHQIHGDARCAQ